MGLFVYGFETLENNTVLTLKRETNSLPDEMLGMIVG